MHEVFAVGSRKTTAGCCLVGALWLIVGCAHSMTGSRSLASATEVSATSPLVGDSTVRKESVLKTGADRNRFLIKREKELAHLEKRLSVLRARRANRIDPRADAVIRDLDTKIGEARDDIHLLSISSQPSWERYQVHLDNTLLDTRKALRKAEAEK